MKSKSEFIIPFVGLKMGFHEFDFEIHESFFEDYGYSIVQKGELLAKIVLEKKETMLIADFEVEGMVTTLCDRCNDPLDVKVKGNYRIIYTFGTNESNDESLVILHPDSYEVDFRDPLYELITISLPIRKIHPKGECNEEMMELLNKYGLNPDDTDDEEEEWDEDDWDDDDWDDDEDWEDDEDDQNDPDDGPIDPRWSVLKNLN